MKKVFLGLLVAGVALAGSAFTNHKTLTFKYSPISVRPAGGIYVLDMTRMTQGNEYECATSPNRVCTFQSNTPITGTDAGGTYISPSPTQYTISLGIMQML